MSGSPGAPWRRLLLGLAVVAALAAGGVWWWRRDPPPAPPAVDLAGADPEVAGVIESARREVLAEPRSADRWGRLGMALRAHDFGAEANACFEQAERLDPAEGRWPYYRGLTLVLTDPEAGLACLRRAVERLQDGPPAPRFRLVEVLLEQGRLDEAAEQLRQARQGDPAHRRGALLEARLAAARGDWKAALAAAEGCRQDPRARKQAHLLAADAYRRLGQAGRAEEMLEAAARLPADAGWYDPLVGEVERLRVDVGSRLRLAEALVKEGRSREAAGLLEGLLRDHPREVPALLLLAQALWEEGDRGGAEGTLSRAVEADGASVEGWFNLGVVRLKQAKHRESAHAFRRVVRLKPDYGVAHYNLGLCLKLLGDPEGARRAWREALRCQPDYAPARRALAEAEKAAGGR